MRREKDMVEGGTLNRDPKPEPHLTTDYLATSECQLKQLDWHKREADNWKYLAWEQAQVCRELITAFEAKNKRGVAGCVKRLKKLCGHMPPSGAEPSGGVASDGSTGTATTPGTF